MKTLSIKSSKPLATAFALALFSSFFSTNADAAMVYGQITGPGEPLTNGTTMLEGSDGERKQVMVDSQGRYRISVSPGDYRVIYQNRNSKKVFEGWLISSPNASKQDVKLAPAR